MLPFFLYLEAFDLQGCLSNTFHQDQILDLEFASGQNESHSQIPLILITLSVAVTLILRFCTGPLTSFPLQGCACLLPCFPSGLWPPLLVSVPGIFIFFLPLLSLLLVEDEEGASKHPMTGAGWGLLAALKQELLDHPIHLCYNYMLLLGDYVSLSSLCNCSYAHKQCK